MEHAYFSSDSDMTRVASCGVTQHAPCPVHIVCRCDHLRAALGMHDDLAVRLFLPFDEHISERNHLVCWAEAVPRDDLFVSLGREIVPEILIGDKQDSVCVKLVYDLYGVC